MDAYHNIEPSAFEKGRYVGYSEGKVYIIRRYYKAWRAVNQSDGTDTLIAPTLGAMSNMLRSRITKSPRETLENAVFGGPK